MLDNDFVYGKTFPMGDPPDYEPPPEASIAAIAAREGKPADEVLYDYMLRDEGRELLLLPFLNYSDTNCDAHYEMLMDRNTIVSLGDGGAHCGLICDASLPTFLLTHWVRDRTRGPKLPLAGAIQRITHDTASFYGLHDRGVLKPGYKADLNLIDLDNLTLHRPAMAYDLPAGARRLLQKADGYVASIVSGEVVMSRGEPTDARPGRLLRRGTPAPH